MPSLVAPNPEYDTFNEEWQKTHPFTNPSWNAPYTRPAEDTDVWNGMAFGDWKKQLSDYINAQNVGWQDYRGQGSPVLPPTNQTTPAIPQITPPMSLPGITPPPSITTPSNIAGQQPNPVTVPEQFQIGDNWKSPLTKKNPLADNWALLY